MGRTLPPKPKGIGGLLLGSILRLLKIEESYVIAPRQLRVLVGAACEGDLSHRLIEDLARPFPVVRPEVHQLLFAHGGVSRQQAPDADGVKAAIERHVERRHGRGGRSATVHIESERPVSPLLTIEKDKA